MTNRDVWVLLEAEDRKIKTTSIALMDEGKRLSIPLGGRLHAVMFGQKTEGIEQTVGAHGAESLYLLYQETQSHYGPHIYQRSLAELLLKHNPFLFLAAASSFGSNLIPRVAAQLHAPLVTNCVEIRAQENVEFIKPVQNGRLHATVICKTGQTKMATVSPAILTTPEEKRETKPAEVLEIKMDGGEDSDPIQVEGFLKADHRTIDINEADVIVAVGRGIGLKERFKMFEEFADRIQAALGGTRPVIDAGILPYERQIGQTGKMVSPKLVVMCGISGAMEFMKGIESAGTKIAINLDRQAPVFKSVDLGIVGDLKTLIPSIVAHIDRKTDQTKRE
jgi:electron transfer flavoprotein alpha subunit